jgi:hypothetical protein
MWFSKFHMWNANSTCEIGNSHVKFSHVKMKFYVKSLFRMWKVICENQITCEILNSRRPAPGCIKDFRHTCPSTQIPNPRHCIQPIGHRINVVVLWIKFILSACSIACYDKSIWCNVWKTLGECERNRSYMKRNCRKACGLCSWINMELSMRTMDNKV